MKKGIKKVVLILTFGVWIGGFCCMAANYITYVGCWNGGDIRNAVTNEYITENITIEIEPFVMFTETEIERERYFIKFSSAGSYNIKFKHPMYYAGWLSVDVKNSEEGDSGVYIWQDVKLFPL